MSNETWRPIHGYEGIYSVSSLGGVKRDSRRILQLWIDIRGYATCSLSKVGIQRTGVKVHQLVARAFLGPCPDGHEVNHIDGVKSNNCATNLEYATRRDNILHAFRMGLSHAPRGEKQGLAKLTSAAVIVIRGTDISVPNAVATLATHFHVSAVTIRNVLRRKTWKHL